jgi:hypothetical protein
MDDVKDVEDEASSSGLRTEALVECFPYLRAWAKECTILGTIGLVEGR